MSGISHEIYLILKGLYIHLLFEIGKDMPRRDNDDRGYVASTDTNEAPAQILC